eukprot:4941270-Lingulodinium_polyedra.AAC.1
MLEEWCNDNQALVITDRVSERQFFPSKITVVVMEDYLEKGADGEYLNMMKQLHKFKNAIYMLPTDGPPI